MEPAIPRGHPPFARLSYSSPDDPLLKKAVINAVELATGRRRLERLYKEAREAESWQPAPWEAVLDKLEVKLRYNDAPLQKAPATGPLVFVANHPFGVLDGLILGYLVSQVRSHFYVMANEVLAREASLAPYLLPIDFRENPTAFRTNLETRARAMEHLKGGGALAIFPAGGVATAPRFWKKARDLEWKRFVAKLIQVNQATVVPLYFHGQNSRLFQLASQLSLNLRLSLLLNEIRNKIGAEIAISIGSPIPYEEIGHLKNRQQLLDHLRELTLALGREQ